MSNYKIALFATLGIATLVIFALGMIRFAYRGRLLPGTVAYDINVSGLTKDEAINLLRDKTSVYAQSSTIVINGGGQAALSVPASEVELGFNPESIVTQLYRKGRDGQIIEQLTTELRLLFGTEPMPTSPISYNPLKLHAILASAYSATNSKTQNASLELSGSSALVIREAITGNRLNLGQFLIDYESVVRRLERGAVTIRTKDQPAALTRSDLEPRREALSVFASTPLTLTSGEKQWTVPQKEVLSWLSFASTNGPKKTSLLSQAYPLPLTASGAILDATRVRTYLGSLAPSINRQAIDARLTVADSVATVFQQSQDGQELSIDTTLQTITENMQSPRPKTNLPLTIIVTKAEVSDDNIEKLGIRELLSEGVTFFPGSSANRITNVRVGAKRFQGALLKPGQIFSFGEILGPVGPEQGYKEGRIILEGRQESAYGGGLCQVSSTAYRAALLAGLPIVERYNHSFAVSYYTAPYGVPGVDATIYYPQVDLKFKNDTDHHILIQTEMVGTTLKFRFYGTKKKVGILRGPTFIYGSNDPNAPSKTVFYRDVVVDGKVVKTDTVYTTYRSALDFPAVQ